MTGCPDDETLAAYLDGQLFVEDREAIEEHLSRCPDCAHLLAGAVRMEAAAEADLRRDRVEGAVAPLAGRDAAWRDGVRRVAPIAAVLAFALLAVPPGARRSHPTTSLRAPLLAAVGADRPVLPRLSGGFRWAPLAEATRAATLSPAAADPSRWHLFGPADAVRRAAERDPTPEAIGAMGAALLLVGHPDDAVRALSRAVAAAPADAALRSDLAAALMVRGLERDAPQDLVAAFELADALYASQPHLLEAAFNRALALEHLHLPQQARAAWLAYAAADPGPWGFEARQRLAGLRTPPAEDHSVALAAVEAAARAGDGPRLARLVREHRLAARQAVERRLLHAWGEALLTGYAEQARAALDAAARIGAEWRTQTGDPWLYAPVAEIEAAPAERRQLLARGWVALGEALAALDEVRPQPARLAADEARRHFRAAGSEAAVHAAVTSLATRYYQGDRSIAGELARLAPADPGVRMRRDWVLGLAWTQHGDYARSIESYRLALDTAERFAEAERAAWFRLLLGEVYTTLGDRREAWRQRRDALAAAESMPGSVRLSDLFTGIAINAVEEDTPRLAAALLAELSARNTPGSSLGDAETALWSARIHSALGRRKQAASEYRLARSAADRLPDPTVREHFIAISEAGLAAFAPAADERVTALTRVIASTDRLGKVHRLPSLLLERGRAHRQLGRREQAEADYRRGLQLLASAPAAPSWNEMWWQRLAPVDELFDEMVSMRLEAGDIAGALGWADAGRARALAVAVGATNGSAETALSGLQSRLDGGTVVLQYVLLPDRAVLFRASPDGVEVVRLGAPPATVRQLAATLVLDLENGAWTSRTQRAAVELHRALIAPAALDADVERVVVIPDDELHAVPFAALVDGATGRFLVQDVEPLVAPSIALYLAAHERLAATAAAARSALVFGDPRLDPALHGELSPLPGAAREARAVAALYPAAQLRMGSDATRAALLAALPHHQFVHFAGHALVDRSTPARSALPLAGGGASEPALTAHEIAGLSLADTRVVVLAACETADGALLASEGPSSLARAFLAARVPSVVATLWPMGDGRSGSLVTALHRGLSAGKAAPTALRDAQLAHLRSSSPAERSPTTWAVFQALGG